MFRLFLCHYSLLVLVDEKNELLKVIMLHKY